MNELLILDKDDARAFVTQIIEGSRTGTVTSDALGIEQATNRLLRLQRPPRELADLALTVTCQYCGSTPGNPCRRSGQRVRPHPSRLSAAIGLDR